MTHYRVSGPVAAAVATATTLAWLAGTAGGRPFASPVTIAEVEGTAFAVAQEGGTIAWRACTHVEVRELSSGRTRRVPIAPFPGASPPCHAKGGGGLALARGRVAWLSLTSGMNDYASVVVADLAGGAPRYFRELTNDQFGEGDA